MLAGVGRSVGLGCGKCAGVLAFYIKKKYFHQLKQDYWSLALLVVSTDLFYHLAWTHVGCMDCLPWQLALGRWDLQIGRLESGVWETLQHRGPVACLTLSTTPSLHRNRSHERSRTCFSERATFQFQGPRLHLQTAQLSRTPTSRQPCQTHASKRSTTPPTRKKWTSTPSTSRAPARQPSRNPNQRPPVPNSNSNSSPRPT